jgi:hypothetical protein
MAVPGVCARNGLAVAGLLGDPTKADRDIDGDLGRWESVGELDGGWMGAGEASLAVYGHDLDRRRQ